MKEIDEKEQIDGIVSKKIGNNVETYDEMNKNFTIIDENSDKILFFKFSQSIFVEGNMTVFLDLIKRYHFIRNGTSYYDDFKSEITDLLKRNGYIKEEFEIEDNRNTCVKFLRHYMQTEENREAFYEYVTSELLKHSRLKYLGEILKDKISESIYELYTNIIQHGETEFVSTCGQFFPRNQKMIFSIGNLGNTFFKKINKLTGLQKQSDCIEWALEKGNSSKDSNKDEIGGIGLYTFREFIRLNQGRFQIVSGKGYYEEIFMDNKLIKKKIELNHELPGTIVTLTVNLNHNFIFDLNDLNDLL